LGIVATYQSAPYSESQIKCRFGLPVALQQQPTLVLAHLSEHTVFNFV
jgi:hypothetical protein